MDVQEQKFIAMTQPPVPGIICRLAVPCIISMLVTAFYNMADTFFVGMLKSNAATGAVGVVFSMMAIARQGIFFIPLVLFLPLVLGVLGIQMSQAISDLCTLLCAIPLQMHILKTISSET